MSQWSTTDNANGSPLWTPAQVNLPANTANRDAMFGNTTADAFVTGQTVGVFGVDSTEIAVGAIRVSAATVNALGSAGSYVPGETLTIDGTGATGIAATLTVATTQVRTVTAQAASGSGYANGDTVTPNTGTATTDAIFTVTTGGANTSIASLALTGNGVYTVNPTLTAGALRNLTVANTSANGGTATLTMKLKTVSIANPGSYTVAPTELNNNTLAGSASGNGATVALTTARESKGVAHTGWVKKTTGSGGRAGRVHYEVLVAGGITGDSEDLAFPDS